MLQNSVGVRQFGVPALYTVKRFIDATIFSPKYSILKKLEKKPKLFPKYRCFSKFREGACLFLRGTIFQTQPNDLSQYRWIEIGMDHGSFSVQKL